MPLRRNLLQRFQLVSGLIVALIVLAIGLHFWQIYQSQLDERARALVDTETRALQFTGAVANRLDVFVRGADYALQQLRVDYGVNEARFRVLADSLANSYPERSLQQISFANERGELTYSNLGIAEPVNIRDREHFKAHLEGGDRLFVSKPVMGRVSKAWTIQFSRPVIRDGRLKGVAVLSFSPGYVSQMLAAFELAPDDNISLFQNDGTYLARSRGIDQLVGKTLSPARPFMQAGSADQGSYRAIGFADGADRSFAWRRLSGTDLVVTVGLGLSSVMAPLDLQARREWISAVATAIALLLLAVAVLVLLSRLARRQLDIAAGEARFRDLTELSSDWYWERDRNFRVSFLSDGFQQRTGLSPDAVLGTLRWEDPYRTPLNCTWEEHRATLEAHQPFRDFQFVAIDKKGGRQFFAISGLPKLDASGDFAGYHGVGANITESKLAVEALRERDTRLTGLIDSAMDAIVSIDDAHQIVLFNASAEKMFGYQSVDVIGKKVDVLIPTAARATHDAQIESYKRTGVTSRRMGDLGQVSGLRADGTEFPIEASISQVQHEGRTMFTVILRDVSERSVAENTREKLEAQLRQAQKMESLGTLAGGIAHDFNNILAAILGNAELARMDVAPGHPVLESLVEIEKASQRARELVRQILSFSRQQPQQLRVVDLREVAADVVKLLRASLPARIEFVSDFAANTPNIQADATQVHQVMMNLGTNAYQAMGQQAGQIRFSIETAIVTGGVINVNLPRGHYVHLSVTDTGSGMDAETMERIFDPFFTTKAPGEGTGLGLSVVSGIVSNHGGSISVYSQPGKGTTFHVYFPAIAEDVDGPVAPLPEIALGEGQRILYLDDEQSLVTLATRLLGRLGYRVKGFSRPAVALEAFRADPAGFDLVITDFNMPLISGLEVAGEVLRLRPDMPVLLASGYLTDDLRTKALAHGVREVLYKPIGLEDLAAAIRRTGSSAEKADPKS